MDIDIENLFSARDSENTENLQELGRQISEFTKQTKDRKPVKYERFAKP